MNFDSICVIGLGYIGLPTATMFASRRKKVVGVDINEDVVKTINRGEIHIVEPALDISVHAAVKEGYLKATTSPEPADAFLLAVPTPFRKDSDSGDIPTPDLSYIRAATESIASVLKKGDLIILESTSPVGTTEKMAAWLADARSDLTFPQDLGEDSDIRIAHCPERVLPGHVMQELIENDRIIGGVTPKCAQAARELYQVFVRGDCLLTNVRTAEMTKLTENAFRDTNIAFANELSIICDKVGIDVWELIRLANHHPRVNILQPGPGVGGHCIAVDPWFIVSQCPSESVLLRQARYVNDSKPAWVIKKIQELGKKYLEEHPNKKSEDITVAFYGVSFKADIDDLRESPAIKIVEKIAKHSNQKIIIIEPNIKELPEHLKNIPLVTHEDAEGLADLHVLLVDHKVFKTKRPQSNYCLDFRGCWAK